VTATGSFVLNHCRKRHPTKEDKCLLCKDQYRFLTTTEQCLNVKCTIGESCDACTYNEETDLESCLICAQGYWNILGYCSKSSELLQQSNQIQHCEYHNLHHENTKGGAVTCYSCQNGYVVSSAGNICKKKVNHRFNMCRKYKVDNVSCEECKGGYYQIMGDNSWCATDDTLRRPMNLMAELTLDDFGEWGCHFPLASGCLDLLKPGYYDMCAQEAY
jgi:hypothetical protein